MHLDFIHNLLPPANEVWGKVICLHSCVCPQGGVPDQVHLLGPGTPPGSRHTSPGSRHPREQTPQSRHPSEQTPPQSRHPPEQTAPCPQGENLTRNTPGTRYIPLGADTPSPSPPPERGRYASYWNAILLIRSVTLYHYQLYHRNTSR